MAWAKAKPIMLTALIHVIIAMTKWLIHTRKNIICSHDFSSELYCRTTSVKCNLGVKRDILIFHEVLLLVSIPLHNSIFYSTMNRTAVMLFFNLANVKKVSDKNTH